MRKIQLKQLALMGLLGGLALGANVSAADQIRQYEDERIREGAGPNQDNTDETLEEYEYEETDVNSCGGRHGCGGH